MYEAPGPRRRAAVRTGAGWHWGSAGGRDTSQQALAVTDNYHDNPKLLRGNKSEKSRTFKLFLICHKNTKTVQWGCLRNIQTFLFTISWERKVF